MTTHLTQSMEFSTEHSTNCNLQWKIKSYKIIYLSTLHQSKYIGKIHNFCVWLSFWHKFLQNLQLFIFSTRLDFANQFNSLFSELFRLDLYLYNSLIIWLCFKLNSRSLLWSNMCLVFSIWEFGCSQQLRNAILLIYKIQRGFRTLWIARSSYMLWYFL